MVSTLLHTLQSATFSLSGYVSPLLAAEEAGGKMKASLAWALVLLCVVLGMLVTVNPVKRETEIKGRKE